MTNKAVKSENHDMPDQLGFTIFEVAELLKIAKKRKNRQNRNGKQYVMDCEGRKVLL